MSREREVVQQIVDAWNNPGVNPRYHADMKAKLKKEWPTLAYAVEALARTHGRSTPRKSAGPE